jgi:hypothetical protein
MKIKLPAFCTSALDGCECLASSSVTILLGQEPPVPPSKPGGFQSCYYKIKVQIPLCLSTRECGCIPPCILDRVTDGGEWWTSHFSHFSPGERATFTHWIGGWLGFGASLIKLR